MNELFMFSLAFRVLWNTKNIAFYLLQTFLLRHNIRVCDLSVYLSIYTALLLSGLLNPQQMVLSIERLLKKISIYVTQHLTTYKKKICNGVACFVIYNLKICFITYFGS